MDLFRALLATEKPEIVGITETWIHTNTRDFEGEFEIPGYITFKKDRLDREGGGVMLYVRGHLDPVECKIETEHEMVGVVLNKLEKKLHIYLVYRPPHQSAESDESLYSNLSTIIRNKFCIVAGDFNCSVNWKTQTADAESMRLLDFANEEYLTQWVDKPTRGNNTLDLVFPSEDNMISKLSVGEKLGKSDHNIIYINDLDLGLVSKISKFADDTKMGINADSDAAVKQLQEDLRKVGEWSKKWQMPFNLDKCKIMHIGHKNKNEKYELLGKEIESVQQEKDLGVVITNDLKSSNQCIEAVKKAQKLLGYIKRQFRTRNKETILTLYNALVRPHLEYAVQFWSPSLRKDIERLEAVQARATKLIPSIRHLGYVRRLERLNLYSLEKRRLRGQLIETFKMLKGVNNIDYRHLFTFSNNLTRSNGWKLELKRFNTSQCGNFFTYKIAPIWNRLPAEAVNSASVEQFKIELDKVIDTLI